MRSLGAAQTSCPHLDHVVKQVARQVEQVHCRPLQQVYVAIAQVHLAQEDGVGRKPFEAGHKLTSPPERWGEAKVCDGHERYPCRGALPAHPLSLGQGGAKRFFHQCRRTRLQRGLSVLGVKAVRAGN